MKLLSALLLGLSLSFGAFAEEPGFVRAATDKATYAEGEKSVLMVFERIQPDGHFNELYVETRFDGVFMRPERYSDREWIAVSPRLLGAGPHDWEIIVYSQNGLLVSGYQESIRKWRDQIDDAERRLIRETDPDRRATLEALIARNQRFINETRQRISEARRLLEIKHVTISSGILKAEDVKPAGADPLNLSLNKNPGVYTVGERAVLNVHVNKNFNGVDGATENVVRVKLGNDASEVSILGPKDFSAITRALTADDVGTKTLSVTLLVRSLKESNALNAAIDTALDRRAEAEEARKNAEDPLEQGFWQSKIDDLNLIVVAIQARLEAMLTVAAQASTSIAVTN